MGLIVEVGKTYLTKHGRFTKLVNEPWAGIYNGEYEEDGRGDKYGRWKADGRRWDYLFLSGEFYISEHDIIMKDCVEARELAAKMKLERKQKAYEEAV